MKRLVLLLTHLTALAAGFAGGIYALPILTAPPPPPAAELSAAAASAQFQGQFRRDLAGSDALHWGEGTVSIGPHAITHQGRLAPGPDYQLYLSPAFVDTEAAFQAGRAQMRHIGAIRSFEGFSVPVPPGVDPAQFSTAVVWCESFSQFISAARYR